MFTIDLAPALRRGGARWFPPVARYNREETVVVRPLSFSWCEPHHARPIVADRTAGGQAMDGATYVLLSGTLTFGVPLALALRELIELKRRSHVQKT